MTEEEVKTFFKKYNIKIIYNSKEPWYYPFRIGKNTIKLGTVDRNYVLDSDTTKETYNYCVCLMDLNEEKHYFENFEKCCQYYENKTVIRYKKISEQKRLKNSQEDFE